MCRRNRLNRNFVSGIQQIHWMKWQWHQPWRSASNSHGRWNSTCLGNEVLLVVCLNPPNDAKESSPELPEVVFFFLAVMILKGFWSQENHFPRQPGSVASFQWASECGLGEGPRKAKGLLPATSGLWAHRGYQGALKSQDVLGLTAGWLRGPSSGPVLLG